MPLKTRLEEIRFAVSKGAKEIDIVIDRSLVLTGQLHLLYQEIQQMKDACGPDVHMKAILACGELENLNNVSWIQLQTIQIDSPLFAVANGVLVKSQAT